MAPDTTEYEQQRLENIRKNNELLKSLGLGMAAMPEINEVQQPKALKSKKKRKALITISRHEPDQPRRRSLRSAGIGPDNIKVEIKEEADGQENNPDARVSGLIDLNLIPNNQDLEFLKELRLLNQGQDIQYSAHEDCKKDNENKSKNPLANYSIQIPFGSVKICESSIYSIDFNPASSKLVAAVGSKRGHLSFWDVSDTLKQGEDQRSQNLEVEEEIIPLVHTFKPHSRPVSRVLHSPSDANKIYTSSYDGSIRVFDVEAHAFEELFVFPTDIGSISIVENSVWFCSHSGQFGNFDKRAPSSATVYKGSEKKINTVEINKILPNYLCTAGIDRLVRIFDIRNLKSEAVPLKFFQHKHAVNSASWDPVSGKDIVSVSFDDTCGLWKDALSSDSRHIAIKHNNHTGAWVQKFKCVWRPFRDAGSNESVFVVGNMTRSVDIYSSNRGEEVAILSDPDRLTAIPAVNVWHPNKEVGAIASGNASGRMSIWM